MLTRSRLLWPGIAVLALTLACATKGNVTKPDPRTKPTPRTKPLAATSPCIKGRVINEEGKGVAYVFVQTKPSTSPAITDANGFYEFCHIKKNTDGSTESTKHPIASGAYTILVKKDGYNAKPRAIQFKGKTLSIDAIRLREKQLKSVNIQTKGQKKPLHRKLPGGIIGKQPTGG